ncbi:hypothetical protein AMATHDRAFT_47377 [Amanita thiersii Skay4041]|uniref:Uncharacterized protein n=1 Tax=Amanita thiersii Skay4041 TaxID=703135 RepID=A0A2A9NTU8_9AGAR|nr:hypothetical protein AMATHDRAFT_47377 [Amanita thiersii Skay4041]
MISTLPTFSTWTWQMKIRERSKTEKKRTNEQEGLHIGLPKIVTSATIKVTCVKRGNKVVSGRDSRASQKTRSTQTLASHHQLREPMSSPLSATTPISAEYIKGYRISREKISSKAGLEPGAREIANYVKAAMRLVNRDDYSLLAWGKKPGGEVETVFVVDSDFDENKLRERPLVPHRSSLEAAMVVLEGPDIWQRVA